VLPTSMAADDWNRIIPDAQQCNSNGSMADDVLRRLEAGQQQLLEKIELQLQRFDELLQKRQRVKQHPRSPKQQPKSPKVTRKALPMKEGSESIQMSRSSNREFERNFERKTTTKALKAYQGAMGWQVTMDEMFVVDSEADFVTKLASGPVWTFVCVLFIVTSTALAGVETQLSISHTLSHLLSGEGKTDQLPEFDDTIFAHLERGFLMWMIVELVVNCYAQGWDFFVGKEWRWNAFDVIVVAISMTIQVMQVASHASFLRVTRLARLLRMGRILRVFRVVKFLRSIRSMLISISGSVLHLLSALLVMCIFMFVVALSFLQCIDGDIQKRLEQPSSGTRLLTTMLDSLSAQTDVEGLVTYYGGLPTTMMTLFLTVSGGLEWSIAAAPVQKLGMHYDVIWTLYIAFMMFGLLNVLTGIFVDSAMNAMNTDRDNLIQTHVEERQSFINAIAAVFASSDTDGTGQLSEADMNVILENPNVVAYFNALGVDTTEAMGLFQLLDDDSSGTVSIDEFVTGFLRLKGSAKAVDMVTVMYENRKMSSLIRNISSETRYLRDLIMNLQNSLDS